MLRNAPLLLALVLALGALLWFWVPDPPTPGPLVPEPPVGPTEPAEPDPTTELPAAPIAEPERASEASDRRAPSPRGVRLQVVAAADGAPIAGAHAHLGATSLAGPTGDDGWLEFEAPAGQRVTFWAAGWRPAEHLTRALPAERVELTPADATLEVLLDNLEPDDGARNSRLEPRDWTTPVDAPWAADLEALGPDRLLAVDVPAGRYQLHVWVGPFRTAGVPLPMQDLELVPGQHLVVRLDASAKPDDEVDR